jgi:hypothetical protein
VLRDPSVASAFQQTGALADADYAHLRRSMARTCSAPVWEDAAQALHEGLGQAGLPD